MQKLNKDAVRFIAVHCSATPPEMDIGVDEIRKWHKEKGWSDVGYHYVIRRSGLVELGRSLEYQGAHVQSYNHEALGVCLVGGVSKNGQVDANFTAEQYASLESVLHALLSQFPGAAVRGHRDFPNVNKACPSFDVRSWWSQRKEAA